MSNGENGLFAFELKSRRHLQKRDFSGLKLFKKDYPMAQCYLIYGGDYAEKHEDITAMSIQHVLFELPELLGFKE